MVPRSSTLAWKIPWIEEPGRLQSIGSAKSWTRLSDFIFTFHFYGLEKEMATHSSILAWRVPGTGEPGGLPSLGSHRVRHDWSDSAAAAAVATEQLQWVLILAIILCIHLSLQIRGDGLSCIHSSLMDRRKIIDFHFAWHFFPLVVRTSSSFPVEAEIRRAPAII